MPLGVGEVYAGYTIVEQLGSGGMGEVYLVQHPRLPRQEALKILRPDISTDETFRQRFIREADSIASIEHPNIVTVHDRGETNGNLWIATQYVDGVDAARLLRRYPVGLPADEVTELTTAIAQALDHAHDRGVLHRDVKPANILLAKPDRSGKRRIFLADFGIARPLDDPDGLTATNFTLGTVAYAAPEQLMGKTIDGRADQYALAATAFHLLTGAMLFPDSNPIAVISHHLTEPPPVPSKVDPKLAPFDGAFIRALAKDPHNRFARCQDFADELNTAATTSGVGSVTARTQQAPVAPEPAITPGVRHSYSAKAAVAGVSLVGLFAGGAALWHPWTQPRGQEPATITTPVTTTAPTSKSSAPTQPTKPPTTTSTSTQPSLITAVSPAPRYPTAGALGQWCSVPDGIGTGPDGSLYYCARLEYTDGYKWSRTPDVIPNPDVPSYTPPPAWEVDPSGPMNGDPCPTLGVRARGPWGLVQCIDLGLGPMWGGPR